MRVRTTLAGLASVLAVMVSGCVVEVDFDPLGSDFTANATWTLNGVAPTSASCNDAKVTHVAYAIVDGGTEYKYPATRFACASGSGSFGLMYPADQGYPNGYQLIAIFENNGVEVGRGALPPLFVMAPVTTANLLTVNFTYTPPAPPTGTMVVTLRWENGVDANNYANCNTAKVMNYGYTLLDGANATVASETAQTCDDQTITVEGPAGNYMMNVVGSSAGAANEWDGPPCIFTITAGQNKTAMCDIEKDR